nr:flagellin [Vallitaleaceae bacterium]
VYEASQDFDTTAVANTGNVLINGTSVAFTVGDDNEAVFDILRSANIPGVEVTYNAGSISVYTTKPLIIEAANAGSTADVDLAAEFTAGLAAGLPLTGSTGNDLVKNIPMGTVDLSLTLTGEISVEIGGALGVATDLTGLDLTNTTDRDTLLTTLNSVDAGNTIFSLTEDTPPKLVSYNIDGLEVTIKPLTTGGATAPELLAAGNDLFTATALGYASSDTILEKGFGNRGRNVQIDATSIIFDDPATVNVMDGFPTGATVTTTGRDIVFQSNDNFELRLVSGGSTGTVTMNLLKTGPLDLQIGANEGQFMEVRIQNLSPRALGITDINLSTSEGTQEAIGIIDTAINTVSGVRSKLGAYQNRLEYTIANLESASENMTASLSRILDADMALEMANFTQQNIIAQAGTSMLAQANQRPQSLLQLLQG